MRVLLMPAGEADAEAKLELKEVPPTLDGYKDLVGGWIEIVRFQPRLKIEGTPIVMVVDDEGLLKEKPINWGASALYGTQRHGHYVHGDVFLVGEAEGPEGADFVDFPDIPLESARGTLTHHITSTSSS